MMSGKIIGIVIAVLLLGGVGMWYATQGSSERNMGQEGFDNQIETEALSGSGTFADLFAQGGTYRCDVASNDPNANSNGIVYIAGDRVRADFETEVAAVGQTFVTHMIQDGGFIYTWTDGMAQGFKFKAERNGTSTASMSGQMTFDQNVNIAYDCTPWSVEKGVFTRPSSVTFIEPAY